MPLSLDLTIVNSTVTQGPAYPGSFAGGVSKCQHTPGTWQGIKEQVGLRAGSHRNPLQQLSPSWPNQHRHSTLLATGLRVLQAAGPALPPWAPVPKIPS